MHELSLCQAIHDTVVANAGGRPVRAVHVRIGAFRQAVPDSMRFSWEVLTKDSDLEGTTLEIEEVPATVECRACRKVGRLEMPILVCPSCRSDAVTLRTGEEFLVAALDVVA